MLSIRQEFGLPLYEHLYSQNAPDFISENGEILKAVECVRTRTEGRGILVMDRLPAARGEETEGVDDSVPRLEDEVHHPSDG